MNAISREYLTVLKKYFSIDTLRGMMPIFISIIVVFVSLFFIFGFISFHSQIAFPDLWFAFFGSSFGSTLSFGRMLTKAMILLILTLGLSVSFRSGLFNIGAVGQMALGSVIAAGIGLFLPVPIILRVIFAFLIAFIVPGLINGGIGLLKAKFGIDEIFITLMSSFVFVAILNYLINDPWTQTGSAEAKTALIPGRFPEILPGLTPIIFIASGLIPLVYILLNKTSLGFEMRVVGSGKAVAKNQGINVAKISILSMLISGGICGIAGVSQVFGDMGRIIVGMPGNLGFYAIPAAIMVNSKPEKAFISAIFLSVIIMGAIGLATLGVQSVLGEVLIGVVFIVTVVAQKLGRFK
jgi:general nucleoside transport system permease protein